MSNERIIQIIPAPDHDEVWWSEDNGLQRSPLVAWALVENEEGDRYITAVGQEDTTDARILLGGLEAVVPRSMDDEEAADCARLARRSR